MYLSSSRKIKARLGFVIHNVFFYASVKFGVVMDDEGTGING